MVDIGFSSLYQKGLSKIYSVEKVRSLGMADGILLEKDKNRWGERSTDGCITVKEKNS